MRPRHVLLVAALSAVAPTITSAQTQLLMLESGMRVDEHLNGARKTSPIVGYGGTGALTGSASENFALLGSITAEARYGYDSLLEFGGFFDVGMRTGPLTIGGGMAARWDASFGVKDPVLGTKDGEVPVRYPIAIGYAGFGKLSLGPGGRFFVQGRYTVFAPSLSYSYHTAEDQAYADANLITLQDVTLRDSHTLRASIGYTFTKVILRAQVIQETFRFDRIFTNQTGAYDRDSRVFSLGLSFIR